MRSAIVGFVSGAALLQTQPVLPDQAALLALTAVAGLCFLMRRVAFMLGGGVLAGFCWAALLATMALNHELARSDEGRDLTITGTVDSLPYRFEQGVRFNFAVESVRQRQATLPPRIALAWYSPGQAGAIAPGERWQLTVRLQRPHGNANPHGFDYEVWLLEQGVRATGYVRPAGPGDGRIDRFVWSLSNVVERCRATLRARIERALAGQPYAGVIVALVVGDQRAIDQSDWNIFNRTGVGHLISISGLHITMVAALFATAASALWRRSFFTRAQLPLLLPAQKVAALAGALAALLYVLLAGFGIPAQRTLYMLCVVAAALWFGRLTRVSHVLCSALGVVVLIDPWAVLAPGFWLSFGAVAMILYAGAGRMMAAQPGFFNTLKLGAHAQMVVTVGLVPLTMLLFSQFSLASPFANAIAIPLISLVVTPLALAGSMLPAPLSALLLTLAHAVVQLLASILGWMSSLPYAVWSAPVPQPWVFCFALLGTVWMLAPRGWPRRWLGLAAWLPLLSGTATHPPPGQFMVTAFDVGQGMALLIETSGHRLLYDTGPMYAPESNGGNRVILPYLKGRGIGRLDGMIVSHSDVDHAGGALDILRAVPVSWVATSLWADHPVVVLAPRHVRCVAGQAWHWDGVDFAMLQPSLASYEDKALKPNARGCTLRISAAGASLLLAADIEAAQEAQLVQHARAALRADVLVAPHHGSGTSSTAGFLLAVQPRVALFQVGYRNRYRHPKAEVYARYGALGITRIRSDEAGAVVFDSADGLVPRAYRNERARYWYGR
ncbi:MAG TPA: DNA internalization-related competence protein ComEC/Rec2 [Telluria sp.]